MTTSLRVATLNLRNIADRWPERLALLVADMAALQPDVLGLQECVFAVQQDRLLGASGPGEYRVHRGWAGRPEYGNAVLARLPLATTGPDERLDLDLARSALRVRVGWPDGSELAVVVTHLHHIPADEELRAVQVERLLAWLAERGDPAGGIVVVGDFNAEPDEPASARMRAAGFRSAFAEVHGADPPVTWPSGIEAPGADDDGVPGCLDYIWVRGPLRATAASLAFHRPAVDDPTLYPSDHLGLVATLEPIPADPGPA